MATPYLHPRSGVFYVRRQLPADVRPAFGYTLHQVSLGTKDAAEAKLRFARASLELDDRIEAVRAAAVARSQAIDFTGAGGEAVVKSYLDEYLGTTARGASLAGSVYANAFMLGLVDLSDDEDAEAESDGGLRAMFANEPESGWGVLLEEHVDGLLAHRKLVDVPLDGRCVLAQAFARLLPDYWVKQGSKRNGQAKIGARGRRTVGGATPRLQPAMTLVDLYDRWSAKRQPSLQTAHEFGTHVREFVALIGDVPAEEITREDLFNYRDEVQHLPKSMSRKDRELPFLEQLAKFSKLPGAKISSETVKKRVGTIQALLKFAFSEMWITAHVSSLVPIDGYSKGNSVIRVFRDDEVASLFGCPLFVAPKQWNQRGAVADSTLFWLFLLGLTVGGRIEEPGQALLADCGKDGGVWFIDITDYVDSDAAGPGSDKRVKNEQSCRVIPIHERLLACGFDKYLDALRAAGATHLFPELSANKFGKRTQQASQRAGRIIDRYAANDARLVFHSFRHLFKSLGRDADVAESILDQICGHVPVTTGGKYGRGARLRTVNANLMKIDFSIVPWDAIIAAVAEVNWTAVVAEEMLPRSTRRRVAF